MPKVKKPETGQVYQRKSKVRGRLGHTGPSCKMPGFLRGTLYNKDQLGVVGQFVWEQGQEQPYQGVEIIH